MDDLQRVSLELSRTKARLNELGMTEELTEAQANEIDTLGASYQTLEKRSQALLLASDPLTPAVADSESQELAQLEQRAELGGIIHSLLGGQQTVGAERELQAHLKLSGNQIPLSMLAAPSPLEQRSISTVGADVARQQDPVVPYVFPQSCAAWLGIEQPTVGVGEHSYPVLTGPGISATPAKGAVPSGTGIDSGFSTGIISTTSLSPQRLQAAFFFAREDRSRLRGLESALRRNLNDALSSGLDAYILSDASSGLMVGGLTQVSDPGSETAYLGYQKSIFDQVDGRYSQMPSDIKLLWGAASLQHASGIYRSTDSDSAYETIVKNSGGAKVSAHVPAAASNIQVALGRKGEDQGAVAPIWEGIEILVDPLSRSDTGEISLTAIMLFGFAVFRAEVFAPLKFKLA